MSKKKLSKLLALYLPYVVIGLLATNLGEAWRLAVGKELGDKIVSLMGVLRCGDARSELMQNFMRTYQRDFSRRNVFKCLQIATTKNRLN